MNCVSMRVQVMAVWLWLSKVPVRWTSRQKTLRTGRVESSTVPLNQETTSSQSASLRNTSQVKNKTFIPPFVEKYYKHDFFLKLNFRN